MNFIEKQMEKLRPKFAEGKPLHFLHAPFDAIDTFLLTPKTVTHEGTHIKDGVDLKRMMMTVVIAMLPCFFFGVWNAGHQHYIAIGQYGMDFWSKMIYGSWCVLPVVLVSYGTGLGVEFIFAHSRKHPVNEGFLVTGLLIPLVMPPVIPLWMVALATIFAVVIAKEAFGGTGMNILNVALTARVFIYFAYPIAISGTKVWTSIGNTHPVDGFTGETLLSIAHNKTVAESFPPIQDLFFLS